MNDTATEVVQLRAILAERQEIDRLQGNRIDELTRTLADTEAELGATHARLRATQEEVRRLNTLLHGYRKE